MGHALNYVLVNQRFKSSVLDTRVFRKTYLQSDHRLVVANIRLKLKAKRKVAQRELRHPTDMSSLGKDEVEEFKMALEEELGAVPTDDVEDAWGMFKEALREPQICLTLATDIENKDWMTDEVREVSKKSRKLE